MADIARFVQNQGRVNPINVLAQAEKLQALRQQNALSRERIGSENALRGALQTGDVNEIAKLGPNVAGQTLDVQRAQELQAANRMMAFTDRVISSANPRAMFEVLRASPEFQKTSDELGFDFSGVGDLSETDPETLRQEAGSIRDALGTFISGNPLGLIGNKNLPSEVREDIFFDRLSPQRKEQFLNRARSRKIVDIGGVPTDVTGGAAEALSTLPAEVAAAEQLAEAEAGAKTRGTGLAERTLSLPQAQARLRSTEEKMTRLGDAAQRILDNDNLWKAVGLGRGLSLIPSSAGADINAEIENLQSQAGLAVLQDMRDNSKTGGAVGQVSNFEQQLFQNNLSALGNLNQSPESYREQLKRVRDFANGSKERFKIAFKETYPDIDVDGSNDLPDFVNMTDEELQELARE